MISGILTNRHPVLRASGNEDIITPHSVRTDRHTPILLAALLPGGTHLLRKEEKLKKFLGVQHGARGDQHLRSSFGAPLDDSVSVQFHEGEFRD